MSSLKILYFATKNKGIATDICNFYFFGGEVKHEGRSLKIGREDLPPGTIQLIVEESVLEFEILELFV